MNKYWLSILCLLLLALGFCFTPSIAAAQTQTPEPAPKIAIVVSLQQGTLRFNDQAQGVLEISNQGDAAIDSASFKSNLPDFLVLHADSCAGAQSVSLELGALPAHSVKTQPFCISQDNNAAQAGSYTVLFQVFYTWGQKTEVVTAEKTLVVDLIGGQTILGLPLAFAGFILPGLMFLLTLGWFEVPWAKLTGENRLIYSVMLSLLMVGPFALWGGLPNAPGLVQALNFSQEVTLPRLLAYVAFGLVCGVIGGGAYQLRQRWLADQTLSTKDDYQTVIRKALQLNPDYHGGTVTITSAKPGTTYVGTHYVKTSDKLFIFGTFRLILKKLDAATQKRVIEIAGDLASFGKDRNQILNVLKVIHKPKTGVFLVANQVVVTREDQAATPLIPEQAFVGLKLEDFSEPVVDTKNDTVLLQILS